MLKTLNHWNIVKDIAQTSYASMEDLVDMNGYEKKDVYDVLHVLNLNKILTKGQFDGQYSVDCEKMIVYIKKIASRFAKIKQEDLSRIAEHIQVDDIPWIQMMKDEGMLITSDAKNVMSKEVLQVLIGTDIFVSCDAYMISTLDSQQLDRLINLSQEKKNRETTEEKPQFEQILKKYRKSNS